MSTRKNRRNVKTKTKRNGKKTTKSSSNSDNLQLSSRLEKHFIDYLETHSDNESDNENLTEWEIFLRLYGHNLDLNETRDSFSLKDGYTEDDLMRDLEEIVNLAVQVANEEIELIIFSYLDQAIDWNIISLINGYYNNAIINDPIFKNIKLLIVEKDLSVYEKFNFACRKGHLIMAKYLYRSYQKCINRHLNVSKRLTKILFEQVCRNGHFDVAKWLYQINGNNLLSSGALVVSCRAGNLDMIRWLFNLDKNTLDEEASLIEACTTGHLDVMKWLVEIDNNINIDTIKNYNDENLLMIACLHGYIDVAKWLHEKNVFDIHENNCENYDVFEFACLRGHLEIVKWLLDLDEFNIQNGFVTACTCGRFELAKWLYNTFNVNTFNVNTKKIDIYANKSTAFRESRYFGHLEISKWLYEIGGERCLTDIGYEHVLTQNYKCDKLEMAQWMLITNKQWCGNVNYNKLFKHCCENGEIETAQMLYEIYGDKCLSNINYKRIFIKNCIDGNLEMAQWMLELSKQQYKYNALFKRCCKNGQLEMARWLYTLGGCVINLKLFESVCGRGHVNVAKWLSETGGFMRVRKYVFIEICYTSYLCTAEWLYEINPNVYSKIIRKIDLDMIRDTLKYGHTSSTRMKNWLTKLKKI